MDMSTDPQPAPGPGPIPEPVTARSLGIANIIFGLLFILGTGYETGMVWAIPAYSRLMDWAQSMARQEEEETWKARLERLEQRMEEAETDEDRARIEAERTLLEQEGPGVQAEMFTFPMDFLDRPDLRRGALVNFGVMTVLNGLLIASGVGLMRLRNWGRSLSRVVSMLMIPAIAAFLVGSIMLAPSLAEGWTADLSEMILGPGPGSPSPEFIEAMERTRVDASRLFAVSIVLTGGLPLLYPIIVLVVTSRAGVRLAVQRPATAPNTRGTGDETLN